VSTDIDLIRRITVLLELPVVLKPSPSCPPCTISHIYMAAGRYDFPPTVKHFLFLAIKCETSEKARSAFVAVGTAVHNNLIFLVLRGFVVSFKKIVLLYLQEIPVLLLSAHANVLHENHCLRELRLTQHTGGPLTRLRADK
jgi:hypothetical protein